MNKLDELLKLTQRNTAEAKRVEKRLDAINREMTEKLYRNMEGNK